MYLLNREQKIIKVHEHYELHTKDGRFISSGATWDKCYDDLKEMLKAEAQMLRPVSA